MINSDKNPEAFYSNLFAECYIPELRGCTYTGIDFLKMSLGQPEIVEEMFLSIEGQHVRSVVLNLKMEGISNEI